MKLQMKNVVCTHWIFLSVQYSRMYCTYEFLRYCTYDYIALARRYILLAIVWILGFRNRMFLAKITGKFVKPVIYHVSYFWTSLTLFYNQGIFVYNPFPCVFGTKACMKLIFVPMDRYWSSLTINNNQNSSRGT